MPHNCVCSLTSCFLLGVDICVSSHFLTHELLDHLLSSETGDGGKDKNRYYSSQIGVGKTVGKRTTLKLLASLSVNTESPRPLCPQDSGESTDCPYTPSRASLKQRIMATIIKPHTKKFRVLGLHV